MDAINRIRVNGIDYKLSAEGAEIVRELDGLGDGTSDFIFAGLIDGEDEIITYDYLNNLLLEDSVNNKVFEPTSLPITVRYNFESDAGKHFFILVPKNHINLYSLSAGVLCFTGWDKKYKDIVIDMPTGYKQYKLFIFGNKLFWANAPVTYTF